MEIEEEEETCSRDKLPVEIQGDLQIPILAQENIVSEAKQSERDNLMNILRPLIRVWNLWGLWGCSAVNPIEMEHSLSLRTGNLRVSLGGEFFL